MQVSTSDDAVTVADVRNASRNGTIQPRQTVRLFSRDIADSRQLISRTIKPRSSNTVKSQHPTERKKEQNY